MPLESLVKFHLFWCVNSGYSWLSPPWFLYKLVRHYSLYGALQCIFMDPIGHLGPYIYNLVMLHLWFQGASRSHLYKASEGLIGTIRSYNV